MKPATFVPVPDWALRLTPPLHPGELLVLGAVLASQYRNGTHATIGSRTLASRLCRDRTSVRRWYRALKARGLVVEEGTERGFTRVRVTWGGGAQTPGAPRPRGGAEQGAETPHEKERAPDETEAVVVRAAEGGATGEVESTW